MLKPHPSAPLEYWFFKVNHNGVALLVDWICRRRENTGVLRTSIHSPQGREVLFSPHPAILRHGAPELAMQETSWPRGAIRWHLTLQPSADRIRPQIFPAEQVRAFDMSLESAPSVVFNGWIEHRGQPFPVTDARGSLSHYWGRSLPREWWWISANQFGDSDIALECTALRSRVWGSRIEVPLGYLFFRNGSQRRLLISPPGRLKVTGSPDSFEILAGAAGRGRIRLKATGRDFGSFGEGILNTLAGDLEIWEGGDLVAKARGTAALERRVGPKTAAA
jgi:hypothetical protein